MTYVQTATDTLRFVQKRFGVGTRRGKITVPRFSRKYLPALVNDLGFTKGAEIGVWRGAFSALFCESNPKMHMLCVDPWQSYQAWLDTKNAMEPTAAAAFIEESYQMAKARLAPLNCTIMREFSADAAKLVPDQSLDFVFIDGNHVFNAVIEDLTLWSKKVKPGGLCMGHDYRIFDNKPTIHVVEAVNHFTRKHKIDPWFVLARDRTPSFLWVKQ
jgi:hypothetical protein